MASPQVLKIVVVGDSTVGKTSMLYRYTRDSVPIDYIPSTFDGYAESIYVDGKELLLQLFDTLGGEHYTIFRPLCYPNTDVFLLCFSVASPTSFENVRIRWSPELSEHAPGIPIVLVGTKIDLREEEKTVDSLKERNESPITTTQGQQMQVDILAARYIECSSLAAINVKTVFDEAFRVATCMGSVRARKRRCQIL